MLDLQNIVAMFMDNGMVVHGQGTGITMEMQTVIGQCYQDSSILGLWEE
jgi:hypothetical protein